MRRRSRAAKTEAPEAAPAPLRTSRAGAAPAQSAFGNRAVQRYLNEPGKSLEPGVRAPLETSLGRDISHVRVHTSPRAAASAEAMQAQAYTVGQDIAVGPGGLTPGLLAHEMAHTSQFASPTPPKGPQFKKKVAPKPLTMVERLDKAWREVIWYHRAYVGALSLLAEAVDRGDVADAKQRIAKFITMSGLDPASFVSIETAVEELMVRVFLLGLEQESALLRRHFRGDLQTAHSDKTPYGRDQLFWRELTEAAIEPAPLSSPAEVLTRDAKIIRVFLALRKELAGVDPEELKRARGVANYDPTGSSLTIPDHGRSLSIHVSRLEHLQSRLVLALLTDIEPLMGFALSDLQAGKGNANLEVVRTFLTGTFQPLLFAPGGREAWAGRDISITESDFFSKKKKHMDYFDTSPAGKKRAIGIDFYDKDAFGGMEKSLPPVMIFTSRLNQIQLLERLYGHEKEKGVLTADTRTNAAAMGAKPLQLHSVDSWRTFLRSKWKELTAAGMTEPEAFHQIIRTIRDYIEVFTISTPFNIEDFGENYINRQFPRALTGQLIHDCGVYALRIAYMLSLLREDLGLTFYFVRLPVHLGLVIEGFKRKLPLVIVHSNLIEERDASEITALKKEWAASRKKDATDEAFLGELAGTYFVSGVTMPYRVEKMPDKSTAADWMSYYERKLTPDVLQESKKSDLEQFHLRYLAVNEFYRNVHNAMVVPFWWKVAVPIWQCHQAGLHDAIQAYQKTPTPGAVRDYAARAQAYQQEFTKAFGPIDRKLQEWDRMKEAVSQDFTAHRKELKAPSASVVERGTFYVTSEWKTNMDLHLREVLELSDLNDPTKWALIQPAFIDEKKRPRFIY